MKLKTLANIAMIAAVYTAVCFIPVLSLISFGQIQIRIAEALTMLPLIYKPSIFGVTLGCFLANLIGAVTGLNPTGMLDALLGTLATGLAAYFTWALRDKKIRGIPVLSMAMPLVFNFVIVGAELAALLMPARFFTGLLINGTFVAIGELAAVCIGYFLVKELAKRNVFKDQ